jgi:hypothetical protein
LFVRGFLGVRPSLGDHAVVPRRAMIVANRLSHLFQRSMLVVLLLGVLYVAVPRAVARLSPGSCRVWSGRALTEDVWVSPADLVALREETTVVRVPSYLAAWPHDGIALPGLVAVSDRRTLRGGDLLLWHEMVHQYQYRRDGSVQFVLAYVADWHRGLAAGCSFGEAYSSIGYEKEAHELLEGIRDELGGVYSEEFVEFSVLLRDPSGPAD